MNKICGIYKITNKLNNKIYIGQSINIYNRWRNHYYSGIKLNPNDDTLIHRAMNKYGIENFDFEIIEEISVNYLNEREKYWIQYYDSYNNGYNMTIGGSNLIGEDNPNSKLTKKDVITIRTMYNNKIPFREVYKKYKNIISKRGLQKVWRYETWLEIMPEVYTQENMQWHATKAKGFKQSSLNNEQRKLSDELISLIRNEYNTNHISFNKIAEKYNVAPSTVRKYCLNLDKNKLTTGIKVKNVETNLIFNSYTQAASWAKTHRKTISKYINTNHPAGLVPESLIPATWVTYSE